MVKKLTIRNVLFLKDIFSNIYLKVVYCNYLKYSVIIKNKLNNSSSRLISVTERLLSKLLQESLHQNNLNLTVEQWRILFYLWQSDGINQQELAKRANKEKSTMTRQIDVLEKKGFIFRQNALQDKRNKLLFLTEEGKKIEGKALSIAQSITESAEEGINEKELAVFKKVISQIIKNIS
ncbi:MAG: MarR family transcriptional regulator [Chitinophagales bacterium]|nr:MarR family transcriptional regulator [Chitinophagales bacterium]